jgi:predicted RNA-binding Zn-ribbon protein involved in translation (DUF1610 family)
MNDGLRGLLNQRLAEEGMPSEIPISVAELHRRLLPYALCRDRLGFASKGEYDMGFLRLLVDERSLDVPEVALREAAAKELGSPEPGLALLQRFAASEVRLRTGAAGTGPPIATLETGRSHGDFLPGLDDPLLVPQDESADALGRPPEDVERSARHGGGSRVGRASDTPCRSCHQALPERPDVRFCPHCGADQESWPCPACGEEVERGWSYCALCGKMLPT